MEKIWLTLSLVVISIIGIIFLTSKVKLNSFISLLLASVFLAFLTLPMDEIISNLQEGFGKTMAYIGFLVIFGAIIGITLDRSGGIVSITHFILHKVGKKSSIAAMGLTGFIVGIPIFCDTAYIILSGLAKSISAKARVSLPLIATVLATALFSVHCLVPTHPGVLAGAQIMKTNIGSLILLGILFAIPGSLIAYFWSKHRSKTMEPIIFQEDSDISDKVEELPSPWASLVPIVVPIILILIAAILKLTNLNGSILWVHILQLAGEPVFALMIGAFSAIILLGNRQIASFNKIFDEAMEKAGPILIITAAGGMFGMIIKSTGIGEDMGQLLSTSNLGLWVPFLIAAFLKTAQGSSTVAVITAASFVAPMLSSLGLDSPTGNLFSMLAIGSGSMVFSHANDSYFWVVTKFSEIKVDFTFKLFSSATFIMGLSIFLLVWISSFFVL